VHVRFFSVCYSGGVHLSKNFMLDNLCYVNGGIDVVDPLPYFFRAFLIAGIVQIQHEDQEKR